MNIYATQMNNYATPVRSKVSASILSIYTSVLSVSASARSVVSASILSVSASAFSVVSAGILSIGFASALALVSSGTVLAQHADMQMKPATEKPATIVAGMSSHHHPVSTTKPEAQKFFDQGLAFVYAFNHEEAIR